MPEAVIVSTARTPIGKAYRGAFNTTHGAVLGGHVIKEAVARAGIEPGEVEDVILGCAMPERATGQNIARLSAVRAGLPVTVSGVTVNRFCSSGLQAIAMAAHRVMLGETKVMVGGGLESISLVQDPNRQPVYEDWLKERKPALWMPMIETADIVAARYGVAREAQDAYALESQRRTAAAQQAEAGAEIGAGVHGLVRLEDLVLPLAVAHVVGVLGAPARAFFHHRVADEVALDEAAVGVLFRVALGVELGGVLQHGDHGAVRQRLALLGGVERRGAGVELAELLVVGAIDGGEEHAGGVALRKGDLVAAGAHGTDGGERRDRASDGRNGDEGADCHGVSPLALAARAA